MRKFKPGIEWLAIITAFCWGLGSFFGKRAMKIGHLSPLVGILLRTLTAFILFLILLLFFGKKLNSQLSKQLVNAWKISKTGLFQIIVFEGILAGGIGMFLYYLAISGGDLSIVMPLAFLSPVWGSFFALLYKDEKITFTRVSGLLFTFTGILVITSLGTTNTNFFSWRIEYVALLTGVCWGIGSFYGKRGMKKAEISSFVGITIRSAISFIVLLITIFSLGPLILDSNLIPELFWIIENELLQFFLIVIFEGILAGFLGMLLYYISIKQGELSLVMPLAFTSPVWGAILGILIGGEQFTLIKGAGMVFILYGIGLTTSPNYLKPIRIEQKNYFLVNNKMKK